VTSLRRHRCLSQTRSGYFGRLLHGVRACIAERGTLTAVSLIGAAATAFYGPAAHPSAMSRGSVDWLRAAAAAARAASSTPTSCLAAILLSRCAGKRRCVGAAGSAFAAADAPLRAASCCGQVLACEAIRPTPAVLRH